MTDTTDNAQQPTTEPEVQQPTAEEPEAVEPTPAAEELAKAEEDKTPAENGAVENGDAKQNGETKEEPAAADAVVENVNGESNGKATTATAAEVKESKDAYLNQEKFRLDGRVVVITGASAGCGKETARDLALRGATVVMGNRDLEKSAKVNAQLIEEEGAEKLPESRFVVKKLDLSELESVRSFAEEVKKEYPVIDILINNAGKMGGVKVTTTDGFESQFQTNHLGHFLLTNLLMENLLASPNSPKVINLSSKAHNSGAANFLDDVNCEKSYTKGGFQAYANTKLSNVLFTKSLASKYEGKLNVYAVHPGVVKTELGRYHWFASTFYKLGGFLCKSEKQGAYTTIYCCVSDKAAEESGLYYADSKVTQSSKTSRDTGLADKLWVKSCEMLGITWEV